jgi:filamentous hemagglutinin family protein
MTEQGIGQSGTTDPNVFISNQNGIYFNSIDNMVLTEQVISQDSQVKV